MGSASSAETAPLLYGKEQEGFRHEEEQKDPLALPRLEILGADICLARGLLLEELPC